MAVSVYGDIVKAARKRYDDTTTFNGLTADTDSMTLGQGRTDDAMPYIVFNLISKATHYRLNELTDPIEEVGVSFSVFTDALSPATLFALMDQVEANYGANATALAFTSSNYKHVRSEQTNLSVSFEAGVWHGLMDYDWWLEKLTT